VITTIDYFLISFYFFAIIFVGFLPKLKKSSNNSFVDFFLAGRTVTLPMFVMSLVATWYGSIVGVGEFIHSYGILTWFCFGLPYYIIAFLFAMFFAKKIRSNSFLSIPSAIEKKFGTKPSIIVAFLLLFITIPAPYSLTLGVILQVILPIPLWATILLGTGISLLIVSKGGLRSDLYANAVQFVLMFLGFGILLLFSWATFGSPIEMFDKVPLFLKNPFDGSSIWIILSWSIIALQTFVDPSFHQRCAAASSPKVAQRGILVSIFFWFVFDTLTMITGLYSIVYIADKNPLVVFTSLSSIVLYTPWSGIFFVSILAIVMSTLESYLLVSSSILSLDILEKLPIKKKYLQFHLPSMLIVSIVSVIVSMNVPSITTIIYIAASVVVPGVFYPVVLSLLPNLTLRKGTTYFCILLPPILVSSIIVLKNFHTEQFIFFQNIEPMIPGMLVSTILVAFSLQKRSKFVI